MSTTLTTELLGELPPLSQIATNSDLSTSWIRGGDGLIGFGTWASTTVTGIHRFDDARRWWREELAKLTIQNNVHGSGTGPILFGSFSFSESGESRLVIPKILVGQKNGKSWITWVGDEPQPLLEPLIHEKTEHTIRWSDGSISNTEWQNRVADAVSRIKNGDLDKVVLARDINASSTSDLIPRGLIQRLQSEYPSTWVFLVSNLIGATPELLVRLSKALVTSRVLAGTIRKTNDEQKDFALAASLAKSSKDLEEHEYAVRSVADVLAPVCSSINVPDSPFVLHLSNVMHLATDVTGVVNESASPVDIFTLLEKLHPSAAVCGTPTKIAEALISEIEGMDRSRYAGPVGWIDARGDGEMGIALRCGEISATKKDIRLFAGCGIVAGSDPVQELAESQSKLLPMRTALETL
ncbi:MAG: isochorismate synthase [Actinomycetes bacterium]|jgi:menaquinone-specific isochorismate synthase